ncbi:MAG: molecular chaperone HtpG, partial [Muribaculaceae bacterium]|nr:molecular chaperone HtpG [Muribaculaceae bacterium]
LERKIEKSQFVRVDSDTIDNLIRKEDRKDVDIPAEKRETYTTLFKAALPKIEKKEFYPQLESLDENAAPVVITQNEFMRRMKEMAALQPGMNFYGEMPESYNLVVNVNHPLVKRIIDECDSKIGDKVGQFDKTISDNDAAIKARRGDKAEKDLDDTTKEEIKILEDAMRQARTDKEETVKNYAPENPLIGQLIDLALLSNGLLKGEDLTKFIERSISLL